MQHPFHPDMRAETLAMPEVDPPAPWRRVFSGGIGGLFAVGFAPGTALLLILSSQGRGVIDGLTGERLARDADDLDAGYDPIRLVGVGIGPIAGVHVPIVGDHGGGLPSYTRDGWSVDARCLQWPKQLILLTHRPGDGERHARIGEASAIRALGFSTCGRCLVVAGDYGELDVFCRPAEAVGADVLGWGEVV